MTNREVTASVSAASGVFDSRRGAAQPTIATAKDEPSHHGSFASGCFGCTSFVFHTPWRGPVNFSTELPEEERARGFVKVTPDDVSGNVDYFRAK